ncbi:hypothetical protein [Holophaga foetida]|uniref:hypothetical protein n=1 Tax=Holophaga foetida TaxID=35839 RepID=UPI0011DCA3CF|nr:hypothetical protein [Holophaga foetida]
MGGHPVFQGCAKGMDFGAGAFVLQHQDAIIKDPAFVYNDTVAIGNLVIPELKEQSPDAHDIHPHVLGLKVVAWITLETKDYLGAAPETCKEGENFVSVQPPQGDGRLQIQSI